MLNGDGNDNGNKINRSNKQKKNKLFSRAAHFFVHLLPLFFTNAMPFCTTKTSIFLVTHYFFMEELSYVPTKIFCAWVPVHFYFFHCRSFSPCWPLAFLICLTAAIFMFFFQRNSSSLFSVTRSSSFSVIQVSVDIKNNVKKDSILFLFFLSKSLGWLCDFPPKLKTPRVNCLWCHAC